MKRRTFKDRREACLVRMRETVETFVDLQGYIADNWRYFWCRHGNEVAPELLSIGFYEMRWNIKARNTHSCPLDGVENFMGDPNKPTSYPGWEGNIRYSYIEPRKDGYGRSFESDLWKMTGINTGTGGGGAKDFRYQVILYADDWPAMAKFESWKLIERK